MHTRRKFMGQMLGGATALAARRGWASARILGANGRVRFGLIGAGGYGLTILIGLNKGDVALLLEGAVPAVLLAMAVQALFDAAERFLVPKGLRLQPAR